jgi:H+/Cl- antiporter ClcA
MGWREGIMKDEGGTTSVILPPSSFQRNAPVEIVELLFLLVQGCGCFLDMMALGTTVGTGAAGVKAYKSGVVRRRAQELGEPTTPHNPWLWVFLCLLALCCFLVGLLVWRYARGSA